MDEKSDIYFPLIENKGKKTGQKLAIVSAIEKRQFNTWSLLIAVVLAEWWMKLCTNVCEFRSISDWKWVEEERRKRKPKPNSLAERKSGTVKKKHHIVITKKEKKTKTRPHWASKVFNSDFVLSVGCSLQHHRRRRGSVRFIWCVRREEFFLLWSPPKGASTNELSKQNNLKNTYARTQTGPAEKKVNFDCTFVVPK